MPDRGDAAELVLVAAIAGYHVVDHRRIPERWHPLLHASAATAVAAAGRGLGLSWEELGLHPRHARAGSRAGALHGSIPAVGLLAASALPVAEEALADPRAGDLSLGQLSRRLLLEIPIGTAVYEEVLFRGVLLGLLRRRTTDVAAVAASSALFGAWHILPALEDRRHNAAAAEQHAAVSIGLTVASTAVAGALLARLRLRSGSLLAPIVAHAGINAAGLVAATLVHRRRQRRDGPPARLTP